MHPIYRVISPISVNAVVEDVYDVITPRSGEIHESRRDGAAAALRSLNPALPGDETPINPESTPYLLLRRIPRTPWRVPPTQSALRHDLAVLGIRNVYALSRVTVAFLRGRLANDYSHEELTRLRNIARLMRIRGVDRDTAAFFHDHDKTPLQTPRQVAEASQSTMRSLLVESGYPNALLSQRPEYWISNYAKILTRRGGRIRTQVRPILLGRREVARDLAFWRARAESPELEAAARQSANTIRWLRELQSDLIRGNIGIARGEGQAAYRYLRRVWSRVGKQAVAEGLIEPNSREANGPSLNTVLEVTWRVLARLRSLDATKARESMELEAVNDEDGIQSVYLTDLTPSQQGTVLKMIQGQPLAALGEGFTVSLDLAVADRTVESLAPIIPGEYTVQGKVVNLVPTQRAAFLADLRQVKVQSLREAVPDLWDEVSDKVDLYEAKDAVRPALTTNRGAKRKIKGLLSNSARARFQHDVLDDLNAFERYVVYTPASAPHLGAMSLALNETFPDHYRSGVLGKLLNQPDGASWNYVPADFADPVRFAFVLPQLFARHLPLALARALQLMNRYDIAKALRTGGVLRLQDLQPNSVSPTTPAAKTSPLAGESLLNCALTDLVSVGTAKVESHDVNCSDTDPIYEDMHAENQKGDKHYQLGELEEAVAAYVSVLELAATCDNLADFLEVLPTAHDELIAQAEGWLEGDSSSSISLFDFAYTPKGDKAGELIPLFTGVWRERPASSVQTPTGSTDQLIFFNFFPGRNGGGSDISIPSYEFETGSDGGGFWEDRDDDDDLEDFYLPDLPEFFPPMPPGGIDPPSPNPPEDTTVLIYDTDALELEVSHAFTYLSQILAGLNWLGFYSETVPVWDFDHLLAQARYYAEKADSLQQRALSLLASAEQRDRDEYQADAAAVLAEQGVVVAKAQEALAYAQLNAANASLSTAQQAEKQTKDDVWWAIGMGLAAVASIVLAAPTGGASVGVFATLAAATAAGRFSRSQAVEAGASTAYQVDGAIENQNYAKSQLEVAEENVAAAGQQVALAVEQTALAELESAMQAGYLDLLASQTLTANAYYELLDVIGSLASRHLYMANRIAWLAERAYQWESRRYSAHIRLNYDLPDDLAGRFSSAANLLADIDTLAHERVTTTTDRYQLLRTTYSLLIHDPRALVLLQQSGSTFFRITQKELDLRHPGLYLHALKRVELEFDGLVPAAGVHAVLRTANQSSVRVPHDQGKYFTEASELFPDWCYPETDYTIGSTTKAPAFAVKPLKGGGFSQVLSEYHKTRDGVVLSPPPGALDSFEHLGTDAMWSLDIPRSGNAFDLHNLTDVRIVLYYSAHYSAELAERQQAVLQEERVQRAALLHATVVAADSFARFVATPMDTTLRDVRLLHFDVSELDLPANITDRTFDNLSLFFYDVRGRSLTLRLAGTPVPFGVQVTTSADREGIPDGMVYSGYGDNPTEVPDVPASYHHRQGDFPALDAVAADLQRTGTDVTGRWLIKVLPEDNGAWLLRNDDGEVVTERTGQVALEDGGSLRCDGGSWLHFEVVAHVRFVAGTLKVGLRQDVTAVIESNAVTHDVTATLDYAGEATSVSWQRVSLDGWYELTVRVHDREAVLLLDGIELVRVEVDAATAKAANAGTVAFFYTGAGGAWVADVRVTRLSYDGRALEEVLRETFAAGTEGWSLSITGTHWAEIEHSILDLSSLEEVLLQLDYTGRIDFLEPGENT